MDSHRRLHLPKNRNLDFLKELSSRDTSIPVIVSSLYREIPLIGLIETAAFLEIWKQRASSVPLPVVRQTLNSAYVAMKGPVDTLLRDLVGDPTIVDELWEQLEEWSVARDPTMGFAASEVHQFSLPFFKDRRGSLFSVAADISEQLSDLQTKTDLQLELAPKLLRWHTSLFSYDLIENGDLQKLRESAGPISVVIEEIPHELETRLFGQVTSVQLKAVEGQLVA